MASKIFFRRYPNKMTNEPKEPKRTMRHEWFTWVAKTRKKMSKGQEKQVAHREAMRLASESWPKQKEKLLKKARRLEKLAKLKTDKK